MADKVLCPYCGAKMKLLKTGASLRIWYECECGSQSPHIPEDWPNDTVETWIDKAKAAALRRVDPPNRVLTLEELDVIRHEPVYVDYKYKDRWSFVGWHVLDSMDLDTAHFADKDIDIDNLGTTWRCWLRKPTDDERNAVAWDE